jgi:LysR family transcriptional regulator, glycine cleavage system transcriptional activator
VQIMIVQHNYNLCYLALMTDDPGLSWSQLRAFDACARLSSFNAAALKLSLSPSAVRFQIGLLESRLGACLFERQGGRLVLTEIGQSFARQIERPMHDLLAACTAAQESASSAPLTLTAPPLFARQFLLDDAFLNWCDAHQVRLDVSDNKRDLFAPGLLAAIRLGADDDPDLTNVPILRVELCVAAALQIAQDAKPNDPSWWAEQTLLTPSASQEGWKTAWHLLKLEEDFKSRTLPFSSYAAALEAACAGSGLILAPLPFAIKEIGAGRLSVISDVRIQSPKPYSLIMRKDLAASPRGRALARMLVRTIGALL